MLRKIFVYTFVGLFFAAAALSAGCGTQVTGNVSISIPAANETAVANALSIGATVVHDQRAIGAASQEGTRASVGTAIAVVVTQTAQAQTKGAETPEAFPTLETWKMPSTLPKKCVDLGLIPSTTKLPDEYAYVLLHWSSGELDWWQLLKTGAGELPHSEMRYDVQVIKCADNFSAEGLYNVIARIPEN